MPTYCATGITVSLATCNLQSSLTNSFIARQGAEYRKDTKRLDGLFAVARKLPERPIDELGLDNGAMQFIGANGDLPLYMAEAGENVNNRSRDADSTLNMRVVKGREQTAESVASELPVFSECSTLTSLGDTPTNTQQSFELSPKKPNPVQPVEGPPAPVKQAPTLGDILQSTRSIFAPGEPQALIVNVDISAKSFLPLEKLQTLNRKADKTCDLKIEIFVNGELTDVSYVPSRLATMQFNVDKTRCSGLKIHRQVEKPIVYTPSEVDDLDDAEGATRRWQAVASNLVKEADIRGKDYLGYVPPSAEYLFAVADLDLPDRMAAFPSLGVVDVVITGGKGKKYGPETTYLTQPTRLADADYTTTDIIDPFFSLDPVSRDSLSYSNSMLPPLPPPKFLTSSPDVPLIRSFQDRDTAALSPSPKKVVDLAEELGLDAKAKKTLIQYDNSRGGVGKPGRTLGQRLGDVKKMNKTNMEKELEKLKADFASPGKKAWTDNSSRPRFMAKGLSSETIDQVNATVDPLPEGADPQAMLTQSRIDIALGGGAASNGPLLRHIVATSPQHTPRKITKASSLANSPTHVPVKSQRRPSKADNDPITPQKRRKMNDGSPLRNQQTVDSITTPVKQADRVAPSPGSNRTSRRWNPTEPTPAEAVQNFKVPEACIGSCVSFAPEAHVQRQIGKARAGEFKEEMLVVGMRFVVV